MSTPESILIVTSDQIKVLSSEKPPGETKRGGITERFTNVTVNKLKENMTRFLNNLNTIISDSPEAIGGMTLDEVEIHTQVDGKGNIGLVGVASGEIAVQGGIKFVLRKRT